MTDDGPSFEVSDRPERRYTAAGGVEYEGEAAFLLKPVPGRTVDDLEDLLRQGLAADRYVIGDWFDLPLPTLLVRDHEVGTAFRVVVRQGRIELHLLPDTDTGALAALYRRLRETGSVNWQVDRRVEAP
ncbi:MAG: hypothetical protein V5A23_04690 [Halobacteriales archaeon]